MKEKQEKKETSKYDESKWNLIISNLNDEDKDDRKSI